MRSMDIAPLQYTTLPAHLDGSFGEFRSAAPNALGLTNDVQAIHMWLTGIQIERSGYTFQAYRREVDRFLIWCTRVRGIPLSSVKPSDVRAYKTFLANVPTEFLSDKYLCRSHLEWRPFSGQLSLRSQEFALTVVHALYGFFMSSGYLLSSPFASIKGPLRTEETDARSCAVHPDDVAWLRDLLAQQLRQAAKRKSQRALLDQARMRRASLLVELVLKTGLTPDEIQRCRMADIVISKDGDKESASQRMLQVHGGRLASRCIPISEDVYALILAHHQDACHMWGIQVQAAPQRQMSGDDPALEMPLFCALVPAFSPRPDVQTGASQHQSKDLSMKKVGIYRTLADFIRSHTAGPIEHLSKELRVLMGGASLDNQAKPLSSDEQSAMQEKAQQLQAQLSIWRRRSGITLRALRYTFERDFLSANPTDAGIFEATRLMGRKSIVASGKQVVVTDDDKIRAIRNLRIFG